MPTVHNSGSSMSMTFRLFFKFIGTDPNARIIARITFVLTPQIFQISLCKILLYYYYYYYYYYYMSRNYRCVKFVNLSMNSLGIFSHECSTLFLDMNDIGIDKKQQLYKIKRL